MVPFKIGNTIVTQLMPLKDFVYLIHDFNEINNTLIPELSNGKFNWLF